ncbi:hypothetical protein AC249_AIPGENE25248 [Exaiptasia diaphana]|nr:hypothetical protein AC249_AIPGENE25248 [Exaiptasia diaphana]
MFGNSKRLSSDAHSSRGVGTGSRIDISNEKLIERGWRIEKASKSFKWISPEGHKFYSSKAVGEFLRRNTDTEMFSEESDADYLPSSDTDCFSSPEKSHGKRIKLNTGEDLVELPLKYHIAMTSQQQDFVDQINATHRCNVLEGCEGKLDKGLGGAVKVSLACSGCENEICYSSSQVALTRHHRNCVSLAIARFLVYGQGYHSYYKVLKLGMGIDVLANSNFQKVIHLAYPHVLNILDGMCKKGKEYMKSKAPTELGSWQRAVTTSDGCWLIRGFHSQCCTFVILDFLSGGILYYGHLCMRGRKNICQTDLWEGTSKSAEGHLAYLLFKKAKEEGLNVALNWQDQDSTAEISFRSIFPDRKLNRVILCGGHVGRSYGNNLKEYKAKKVVDKGFIDKHKNNHPEILKAKCSCERKKHSKSCGCLSDDFIASAKRNHFSALKQSQNCPEEYARRMKVLRSGSNNNSSDGAVDDSDGDSDAGDSNGDAGDSNGDSDGDDDSDVGDDSDGDDDSDVGDDSDDDSDAGGDSDGGDVGGSDVDEGGSDGANVGLCQSNMTFMRKFVQRQKIIHSYGREGDDDMDEDDLLQEVEKQLQKRGSGMQKAPKKKKPPAGARIRVCGQCRCGSTEHLRTSHMSCPYNKRNKQKENE